MILNPKRVKPVVIIIFSAFSLIVTPLCQAQVPPREVFNFIFENTFNDDQVGSYQQEEYQKDWNVIGGFERLSTMDILAENENNFMRGYFPEGTIGPEKGGWSFYSPVKQKVTEMYFSYDIRFKPGFIWVHGGKIPGLIGGRSVSGRLPEYSDGFSIRPMWKGYGSLVFYVYHHDQTNIYGTSYDWDNFRFESGKWYNLTFRIVLNSVGTSGGLKNGILEGFVDGKLVFQKTDFRFRNLETISIDRLYICSFFGGDDASWNSAREEWIDTDNYVAYTYGNSILNVPRGFERSSWTSELIHPYRRFSDAAWKQSFNYNTLTSSSINLFWADYPVPTQYILEKGINGVFTTIATLPYGTRSYSDNNLSPAIIYTYRLKAGSSVQEIKASPHMVTPVPPSELKSTAYTEKSVTLLWKDNSNNEESFVINRALAINPDSAIQILVGANDTAYTDTNLVSGTAYLYTVQAVNLKGNSMCSNKSVATTLSKSELSRIREGLIAYYNFTYNPDFIVYDQSGYFEPVDLKILDNSAIRWNGTNSMDLLSNTALVSLTSATKIIRALKKTNELTFECWIKPNEPDFDSNSRIVSLANDDQDVGFILDQSYNTGQENPALTYSIRLQTESTIQSGYPEFQPGFSQPYLNMQHIVYMRDTTGNESLYLNGVKSSDGYRPSNLCTWKDNYYLRLGNESDMNHSWKGRYYSLAFYNRALSAGEILTNYGAGPCDDFRKSDITYSLEVFPNPISEKAYLKLTPLENCDLVPQTLVRVTDIFGKLIHEDTVFNPNIQNIHCIDFSSCENGIYFIHVISGLKQKSEKVIVIR